MASLLLMVKGHDGIFLRDDRERKIKELEPRLFRKDKLVPKPCKRAPKILFREFQGDAEHSRQGGLPLFGAHFLHRHV